MKKIILSLLMLISMVLYLGACTAPNKADIQDSPKETEMRKIKLYYTDKENNKLLSETRQVANAEGSALAKTAIEELIKGPTNSELKKTIPDDTTLIGIVQEGTVVTVDLSKEYYNTQDIDEVIARYSIVQTLCDLSNVRKVKILVEGKELLGAHGEPVGLLGKDDIVFNAAPDERTTKYIKLYFADSNAEKLYPEVRQILITDNEPVEKFIVEELIKGPEDKKLLATIPSESKVLSIETKEGICFVNFSEEFKSKYNGGTTAESLMIYSIVDSLTELPNINKVQFLIGGQKLKVFSHMIFNEPFEKNTDIMAKK